MVFRQKNQRMLIFLFLFYFRAGGGVVNEPAEGFYFFAEDIGFGKVFCLTIFFAFFCQLQNFHRNFFNFYFAEIQPKNFIKINYQIVFCFGA